MLLLFAVFSLLLHLLSQNSISHDLRRVLLQLFGSRDVARLKVLEAERTVRRSCLSRSVGIDVVQAWRTVSSSVLEELRDSRIILTSAGSLVVLTEELINVAVLHAVFNICNGSHRSAVHPVCEVCVLTFPHVEERVQLAAIDFVECWESGKWKSLREIDSWLTSRVVQRIAILRQALVELARQIGGL